MKYQITYKVLLCLLFSFISLSLCAAGNSGRTKVDKLEVTSGVSTTKARVLLIAPSSNQPSCHTSSEWDYMFDTSSRAGSVAYATLLTALAQDKEVLVRGDNDCTVSTSVEDMKEVEIYSD